MKSAWIPNAFTFGNLTCGFVSLTFSALGSTEGYTVAAILILLASVLDGLDGQAARILGVSSPVGKELDSLADCVAFGVAPGFLAYKAYMTGIIVLLGGHPIDLGILMAAVFPICAAYRLARFNIQSPPGSFTGLPSPVAGIIVALVPLCFPHTVIPKPLFAFLFLLVGLLMVSTVGYSKPQASILSGLRGFKLAGLVILSALLMIRFGFRIIFLVIALYILSGLLGYIIKTIEQRRY